jgi:hypothetical protein
MDSSRTYDAKNRMPLDLLPVSVLVRKRARAWLLFTFSIAARIVMARILHFSPQWTTNKVRQELTSQRTS